MKWSLFSVVLILVTLNLAIGQIAIPLQYSRNDQSSYDKSYRHHLLRQEKIMEHKVRSRLSHNIEFIKNRLNSSQQRTIKTRIHQLKTQSDDSHLKIETFNLQPSAYAFSLPMKIDGLKYRMSIDSGSSDIFIKGENAAGKPKRRYHCGQVCIDTHDHYKIGYLDGRLQTYETKLQVEIGEHKFNQSILVAYKVDHNFQENQGLIGLSFSQLATNPNPTFLQTLKNQKIIDVYAFGVNLNFQDKSRSFITFGSFDQRFFQGDLSYFPLTSSLFYYIKSDGISIGDSEIFKIKSAIFDTGNTCISIPHKFQDDILKQFNRGEGNNKNECFFSVQNHADMFSVLRCKVNDIDALPVLNIHLGGKQYSIQKEYYLQACDRRPSQMQSENDSIKGTWYCDTYIQSVSGMSQLFLGDGFFNRYYTYFDLDQKQIGIAKNKEIIKLEKIIQNQLDADSQDWEEILTKLNSDESRSDIKQQIQQALQQQKKKKLQKKNKPKIQ